MKKALLITTVSGFIPQFEMNNVKILQNKGYEVHYASNFNYPFYGTDNSKLEGSGIICHHIDFARSPFNLKKLLTAFRQLKLLKKNIKFDLVHCHTPLGGAIGRIVFPSNKNRKVIYTVHGFHFYKGAPIQNWLIYYPVEKILSKFTNTIITINKEDYQRAKKFHSKEVKYIPGVGIDTLRFERMNIKQDLKRDEFDIPKEAKVILSVGEINKNKNHEVIIKAIADIKKNNIYYLVCGQGDLKPHLTKLIQEYGLDKRVKLLGYRNDVDEIYKISDIFAFPSYREGLSVALMEAMSFGLPCVVSNIRGNKDLIHQGKGGYLVHPDDVDGFIKAILELSTNVEKCKKMKIHNIKYVKNYDLSKIAKKMEKIYF